MVFNDGTYEGKSYIAVVTKAKMLASKIQLAKVLPLLQTALQEIDAPQGKALLTLKEALVRLSEDPDPSQVADVQQQLSSLHESGTKHVPGYMRIGLHDVKATVLKELDTFTCEVQSSEPKTAKGWLIKTHEKYSRWFGLLERWN